MKKLLRKNRKQLNKLTIGLALLLVPSIANAETIVVDTIEDPPKLKWMSGGIYSMISECYRYLNMNSMRNFGAPIIPLIGLNQCSCVVDKIRQEFEYATEYMKEVVAGRSGEIIGKHTVACILAGAMGEGAKKAFLEAAEDENNKTKSEESLPAVDNDTKKEEVTTNTEPVTWDELIKKNGK